MRRKVLLDPSRAPLARRGAFCGAAVVVVLAGALAGCSPTPDCAPSQVFATAPGPHDAVGAGSTDVTVDELGQTRLLHEQDDLSVYLAEWPSQDADVCVWVERDGDFVGSGCAGGWVQASFLDAGVSVLYDSHGDVAERAPRGWTTVSECLAIGA